MPSHVTTTPDSVPETSSNVSPLFPTPHIIITSTPTFTSPATFSPTTLETTIRSNFIPSLLLEGATMGNPTQEAISLLKIIGGQSTVNTIFPQPSASQDATIPYPTITQSSESIYGQPLQILTTSTLYTVPTNSKDSGIVMATSSVTMSVHSLFPGSSTTTSSSNAARTGMIDKRPQVLVILMAFIFCFYFWNLSSLLIFLGT